MKNKFEFNFLNIFTVVVGVISVIGVAYSIIYAIHSDKIDLKVKIRPGMRLFKCENKWTYNDCSIPNTQRIISAIYEENISNSESSDLKFISVIDTDKESISSAKANYSEMSKTFRIQIPIEIDVSNIGKRDVTLTKVMMTIERKGEKDVKIGYRINSYVQSGTNKKISVPGVIFGINVPFYFIDFSRIKDNIGKYVSYQFIFNKSYDKIINHVAEVVSNYYSYSKETKSNRVLIKVILYDQFDNEYSQLIEPMPIPNLVNFNK
jgi:hypothetical protein